MAPVASDSWPVRSRNMVAIGASRTGLFSTVSPGIGDAEIVHPVDLGVKPQDLAERIDDADHEHADDEPVQAGIGQEALAQLPRLSVEDDRKQDREDEEQGHAPEKDLGAREFDLVSDRCHALP